MKRNSFILKKLLPSLLSAAMVSGFGAPSFSLSTFAATSEPALSSAVNTPSDAAKATDSDAEYDEDGFLMDGMVKDNVYGSSAMLKSNARLSSVQSPSDAEPLSGIGFVLMNIPYADFYKNEADVVDSITSATKKGKARNLNVNGASYHQSEAAVKEEGIAGMMYPVKVADLSVLEKLGGRQVKDEDKITYTMNVRGKETECTLEGADALQESPSYSWYVLSGKPANYKTLTVNGDSVEFSTVSGRAAKGEEITGDVTLKTTATGHVHADVEIKLSGLEVEPKEVSAVVITTEDGKFGLHHVVNIWRGTEIGANKTDIDLEGKTITNVRYYLKDGTVTDYPANILVKDVPEEEQSSGRSSSGGSDSDSGSSSSYTGSSNSGSGWKKDNRGWWFRRSDGSWPSNEWLREGSSWYAFDERGYMRTGWYFDAKDRHWYFFDLVTGAMKTGWITAGGKRYFLNTAAAQPTYEQNSEGKWIWKGTDILPLGAMYAGSLTPDGTAVDENGAAL